MLSTFVTDSTYRIIKLNPIKLGDGIEAVVLANAITVESSDHTVVTATVETIETEAVVKVVATSPYKYDKSAVIHVLSKGTEFGSPSNVTMERVEVTVKRETSAVLDGLGLSIGELTKIA